MHTHIGDDIFGENDNQQMDKKMYSHPATPRMFPCLKNFFFFFYLSHGQNFMSTD